VRKGIPQRIEKAGEIDAPVEKVYQVIADVCKYPEFLPGVQEVAQDGDLFEMVVSLGPIDVTWTSRAVFEPYESIATHLVEGPFRQMDVRWEFAPQGDQTEVRYTTDFELHLRLPGIGRIVSRAIEANTEPTMRAFRRRVRSL
jgi:ribosome-associated toxin RatA of RatAB toxin-antitoxin module